MFFAPVQAQGKVVSLPHNNGWADACHSLHIQTVISHSVTSSTCQCCKTDTDFVKENESAVLSSLFSVNRSKVAPQASKTAHCWSRSVYEIQCFCIILSYLKQSRHGQEASWPQAELQSKAEQAFHVG